MKDRYRVGIVKYTGHTSLDRIEVGLKNGLDRLGRARGCRLDYEGLVYDGGADMDRLAAIGRELARQEVDLVLSIATPATVALKPILEEKGIPLIFRAVSDPLGAEVIESFQRPGGHITGTCDALDGRLLVQMLLAAQPDIKAVGLLYDRGELPSRAPVAEIKAALAELGLPWVEATPSSRQEVLPAAQSLVDQGVKAILTPTDNTVMSAELEIYQLLSDAGVAHYTGSNAFTINGAFFGLGSSYQEGDRQIMELVEQVLFQGRDPGEIPVVKGRHDLATVNRQVMETLGLDPARLEAAFAALGARTAFLDTQEEFEEDSY